MSRMREEWDGDEEEGRRRRTNLTDLVMLCTMPPVWHTFDCPQQYNLWHSPLSFLFNCY